jgi:hypothetical protein
LLGRIAKEIKAKPRIDISGIEKIIEFNKNFDEIDLNPQP